MNNFSEKGVRFISVIILIVSLYYTYRNIYFSPLILISVMIYFSTKGVQMFEDKVYISTRLIFWFLFAGAIFFRIYIMERANMDIEKVNKLLITALFISISIGSWLGDFFAKYIYIRLKFFINRIGGTSKKGTYKLIHKESTVQKYLLKPRKHTGLSFFHIILEINGENKKFLIEKDLYDKLENKNEITVTIKKGCLGMYYGLGVEI